VRDTHLLVEEVSLDTENWIELRNCSLCVLQGTFSHQKEAHVRVSLLFLEVLHALHQVVWTMIIW
jgi:hypothetical protein